MSKTLIAANPGFQKSITGDSDIFIAEMFGDTMQGENFMGWPALFLRVQECSLNCSWCCVSDTKILMSDFSYKNIQDVQVGDFVKTYTKSGLIDTKVLNCLKRENIPTVKLTSIQGNSLHCSVDHRLVSYKNHKDSQSIRRVLIQAKEASSAFIKSFPDFTVKGDCDDSYKLGYIKGVLLGDGSCKDISRIKLECCDLEMMDSVLLYIKDLFQYEKNSVLKTSEQKNRKPYYRCVLTKRQINEILVSPPTKEEMIGFVAGFFDAEGSFSAEISLSQKDISVLEFIAEYLKTVGFDTTIDRKQSVGNLRVLGGYREWVRFITFFNPKIKRKFNKIYKIHKIDGGDDICSVESSDKADVFTLTTEQGYYISNNFLSKNCDSKEVWRFGNPYGIKEILRLWEDNGFVQKFKDGQRLVLTGGSPLRQQMNLTKLIQEFVLRHGFKPYIEVENESVLMPTEEFSKLIDCWNNSPKLESSGNSVRASYKPNVIRTLSSFQNSWFKFVVTDEEDWKEIESMYINPGFILKNQVVLMPEGQTREELSKTRDLTVNIAIEHGVRYSDRLHIVLWDKKVGV